MQQCALKGQKYIVWCLCTFALSGRWVAFVPDTQGVALGYVVLPFQGAAIGFGFPCGRRPLILHTGLEEAIRPFLLPFNIQFPVYNSPPQLHTSPS